MFKFSDSERMIGLNIPYTDKETGLTWNIEVFEVYQSSSDNGTYFLLNDNIKVKVGGLTKMKGRKAVIERILELYGKELNTLEYKHD